MKTQILVGCGCAIALVFPTQSYADAQEDQKYLSALISYYDDDEDRGVDDGYTAGKISYGYVSSENWNIEGVLGINSPDGRIERTQLEIGADLLRVWNREGALSPYFLLGTSILDVDREGVADRNGMALSAGLGLFADVFGDSGVAIRGEYRYRADSFSYRDHFVGIGLQIPFGEARSPMPAPAAAPVDPDSDGDGVPEVAQMMILVAYFQGIGYVFKTRQYIVIDFFTERLAPQAQLYCYLFAQLLVAVLCLVVVVESLILAPRQLDMKTYILHIPRLYLGLPLLFASLSMLATSAYYALAVWRRAAARPGQGLVELERTLLISRPAAEL